VTGSSGLTVLDIKPRDKQIRPSTKCKYVEAGLLYSLVSSILRKGDPTREIALGLCRQIGQAQDSEFVYALDTKGSIKTLGENYDGVEGSDVLHSMLCNSMRRLKRKMQRKGSLLLPGRDVWAWEVMARKLSVNSTFDPRVSRSVANNQKALRVCIDEWQIKDWSDVLFFDTGFSGTIPKAIANAEKLPQINCLLLSSHDPSRQIFRTHTGSRAKALAFEYLAKYFVSGTHRDGAPYQELNLLDDFIKAALLTTWLWYHVSPTRLPSYRAKKIAGKAKDFFISQSQGTAGSSLLSAQPLANSDWSVSDWSVQGSTNTFGTNLTSANTTGNLTWQLTTNSGASTTDIHALQTLDSLWEAGTSGQLLIDKSDFGGGPMLTIGQQMMKEAGTEVIAAYSKKPNPAYTSQVNICGKDDVFVPIIDPSKIDPIALSATMQFETVPTGPKKMQSLVLDPNTFNLYDAVTGKSVENQLDAKALSVLKGDAQPTEEGFNLGQYPGPLVVSADALKNLSGAPHQGPIPEVALSIELDSDSSIAGGHQIAYKKTTFTNPDGTKKVYKMPITG